MFSSLDLCWLINTIENNKVIQLDTYSFQLQMSEDCIMGDYVHVRDGKLNLNNTCTLLMIPPINPERE